DHVLWRGVMGTYDVFQPAGPLMFADMQQSMIQTVARSFNLGVQLAAPFVVISVLIGLVMGIMAKLMPQLQIFTLALPVQILSGLLLFAVIFSGIMMLWLERFGDDLRALQMV
ncbi:MAG: flagellar biosynthetic protein FliR, partial [Alphaproteobacteria bacterium]|nr:flagellar biosynthetic protein FliR [Alphaproteobacteria bacterium]